MKTGRIWQMIVVAGLALMLAWTGQARGDFVFGTPVNLGANINSSEREYDPTISTDGLELYFQSYRSGGYGSSDLYVARRTAVEDEWQSPQNLGPVVNTAAAESGPSLSSDGLTLYFNSDRSGGQGGHDLYMTTRASRSEPWGEPVNLGPVVNSAFSEINPSVSNDGLSLYFADVEGDAVSPRPGGVGNTDIWVSTRASVSEPWGTPVNLGTPVNSAWSDGAPDISPDGLLLFFNFYRGDQTFFDIHVATRKTAQDPWGVPANLGAPVNSNNWEGNAELAADGRTLYFISCCRPGGSGATDIWQVSIDPVVDFSGDGKVDDTEVRVMLENWGRNEPLCDIGPTPFGDGIVDMKDLAVLIEYASKDLMDPTLVSCWGFDEQDGIVACDSTATCAGKLMGSPLWQPQAGAVGGALQLDGIDDYVTASLGGDLLKGAFSVFARVKGGRPGQVVLSQQAGANWLGADAAAGALTTELKAAGRLGRTLGSQMVITDGNWHRIGLVWDGTTRRLYVDGRLAAEDVQDGLKNVYTGLNIGCGKDTAPGSFWSGLIDDVRIYNRVIKP